jgi:tetratricopeptide (TPR) repeat protein
MSISRFRSISLGVALLPLACAGWASAELLSPAQSAAGAATAPSEIDSLQKRALQEGETGKTDDAIRDYKRALELQPEWKEGLWNLGMLLYDSNQFAEASAMFQKVASSAPNLGIAWSLLGLSEYETGNYDHALAHLEQAQSLGVQDDEIARVSSYHLGILWIHAGEFDRASKLLMATFGSGVVSPQAKIALGLALLRVPLLPEQLDPSREALVLAAGEAAVAAVNDPGRFPALLQAYPDVPYLHYAYGLALAKDGKNRDALEQFRAEAKLSPLNPIVWIDLSRLQLRQGAVNESLQAAREAIRLAPLNPDSHKALAQALEAAGRKQQAAVERRFVAPASASHAAPEQRIVLFYANGNPGAKAAVPPEANLGRWNQALLEFTEGQYSPAAADFKASLAVTPDNGNGWALLGICEYELKDYDNALIHLDRSAKLGVSAKPEYLYLARYTYGVLLVHSGQFDQATEVLATATKAEGSLAAKVEYALGLALLRRAEFPDATPAPLSPLVTAAGHIAHLLQESNYGEAFPQFKLLLQKYPAEPFLHYAYGTALIAMSEFDQAAAQMQAEAAISPKSELPCLRLASIALRQHDAATATTWSERALTFAPDSVDAHYLLGRASLEAGDLPTAMRELETASKLSPASPEIHFNLAKAYTRAKMPEKAQHERDIFSELNEAQKSKAPATAPK